MSEAYYSDDRATLYNADALAVLRDLPTASVDALITDPPYSSGGMVRGDRVNAAASKYVGFNKGGGVFDDFTGDNRDQRGFAFWCTLWLTEALRVARPGALVMMFTDWRQLPAATDVLQSGGWVYRGVVAWDKHNVARPRPVFRSSVEFCVWGSAGGLTDYPAATTSSILACAPPRDRQHMTQKPLELMRQLVRVTRPGGTVMDPFAGSGTTGVAALLEGRNFIGSELTEHYSEVAANRLRTVARGYRDDGQQGAFELDGGVA